MSGWDLCCVCVLGKEYRKCRAHSWQQLYQSDGEECSFVGVCTSKLIRSHGHMNCSDTLGETVEYVNICDYSTYIPTTDV